ncbi:MAG: hypothetical protein MJA27_22365 [Pseudanabaenales cyanobacterium]|nr:hypothetical protein [Pseudanabaenales cyanobacterium]
MFKPISLSAATFFVMFGIAIPASANEAVEIDASHDASQLLPLQAGKLQLEYNPDRLDSTSNQVNQTVNPPNEGVLAIPLVDEIMNGGDSGQAGFRAWEGASGIFSVGIGSDL